MVGPKIQPRLVVRDAARAIDFYVEVFGARELARYPDPNRGGAIVHAELAIGDAVLTLSEEAKDWHNVSPASLGGSAVILTLRVDDAYAVGAQMERAGAKVIFPIANQFYGAREGRLVDPFGHVWILSQPLEDLSPDEIQRRVDAGG